jgi:hypothetical protein
MNKGIMENAMAASSDVPFQQLWGMTWGKFRREPSSYPSAVFPACHRESRLCVLACQNETCKLMYTRSGKLHLHGTGTDTSETVLSQFQSILRITDLCVTAPFPMTNMYCPLSAQRVWYSRQTSLRKHIKLYLKNGVFWVVTPCGSCKNRRFGGTWRLLHQGDKNRWTRNNTSCN